MKDKVLHSSRFVQWKGTFEFTNKEFSERRFIMEFLTKLSLDELKRLVKFEIIDPDNEYTLQTAIMSNDKDLINKMRELKHSNSIMYNCELEI